MFLRTLARDFNSTNIYSEVDEIENTSPQTTRYVDKYTPYRKLLEGKNHYVNNDVRSSKDFDYPSIGASSDKLKFSSIIVVPIRCNLKSNGESTNEVLGFLKIVSPHRSVFKDDEISLAKAFADSLFFLMHRLEVRDEI